MYKLEIKPEADKIFRKLSRKNPTQLLVIHKKIQQILEKPNHEYKFLHKPLEMFNRVHIDKHFVLIFRFYHKEEVVIIFFYDHHDNIYKWRP